MSRPRGTYLMPTLHPAYLFRSPTYAFAAQEDWKKAVRLQREGQTIVPPPVQEWQWKPMWEQVLEFFTTARNHELALSIDFEATLDGKPVCMAAWPVYPNPYLGVGICVPFLSQGGGDYWPNKTQQSTVIGLVCEALAHPCIPKIGHNIVGYDFGYPPWNACGLVKRAWDCDVQGIIGDTMVAHHAAFAELKHSLSFCASIATDLGPYKTEVHQRKSDDPDEISEEDDSAGDWARVLDIPDQQLRVYCLYDAWATQVVWRGLEREMQ